MDDTSLFGPVREKNVAFLIDTSGSMYFCMRSVQDNLIDALLNHAERADAFFNVIEYYRNVVSWSERSVPCNPQSVSAAARWIRSREASTGNNLLDALLLAFEDRSVDAVYVISNSLPAQSKNEVIDSVLFSAKGRPVNCIYLASNLSDPSAETFMYDLAWETGGSFRVLEVGESGRFQRANLVFESDKRKIRSNSGRVYSNDKYCSVFEECRPQAMPADIGLPWQSRLNPFWWTKDAIIPFTDDIPMTKYHAARALLKDNEIREAVLPTALPGPGLLLIDKKVLARRIEDGFYYLGRVKSEVARDRFLVQFDEMNRGKFRDTTYQEVWIYDIISFVDAFRHPIIPGDNVLVSVENKKYAPAVVLQGHEQRSDPTHGLDRPLIVNHIDGRTETLEPGVAIWIPHKLYERVSFELRLPAAARKTLESHLGYPDAPTLHDEKVEIYEDFDDEIELEGDVEFEEVLVDETPDEDEKTREYYKNLYPQMPWWWRMWWHRTQPRITHRPRPRVIRRTKVVRGSPERHRIQHAVPSSFKPVENVYAEYDDSTAVATQYFDRVRQSSRNEGFDEALYEKQRYLTGRRAMSPVRLSYSEEAGTQTTDHDVRQMQEYERRLRAGTHRPPWKYWGADEPPSQLGDSVYAGNIRASSSPSRRREEFDDRMKRAVHRQNEQRWYEPPTAVSEQQRHRHHTATNIPSDDVEYRQLTEYETRHVRSADHRKHEQRPLQRQHIQQINFDEVARDRAAAEWYERTEPRQRPRTTINHHHQQQQRNPYHEPRYEGGKVIYYETASDRRDESPIAGMPTLNIRPLVVDQTRRSRRANHLRQMAIEEERERRAAAKQQRSIGARASYNASVNAWFTEKEVQNFNHEQERIAALQRKRAEVDARHPHDVLNTGDHHQENRQATAHHPTAERKEDTPVTHSHEARSEPRQDTVNHEAQHANNSAPTF